MSLFRTISDPLVLYLNNPKVAHFAFPLPDGSPRSLVGETYVIAFRRRILTTPLVDPLPLIISGDTLYATAAIPADAIAEINEVADGYLLDFDVIETTYGASTTRWTGQVRIEQSAQIPSETESAPSWLDLPFAEIVADGQTYLISERGARGADLAQSLKEWGDITTADPELARDKLREWGAEGAEPSVEAAQAAAAIATEKEALATEAAERSESAAVTAMLGNIYDDYDQGLAATAIGQKWVSYGPANRYATRWLKTGATTADFQDDYANGAALERVTDSIVLTESGPTAFGDGYGGNMFDMAGGPDRDLPRAPAMQIGDTVISSDEGTVDFEQCRLAARGFVMGGVNVSGDGDRPFGIADGYGASLVDMKGGPLAQSFRVSGGIQFDGIYLAEGPGDWIGASDPYGGWRRLAWFDELPDASGGGTGGDYAARDANNVAYSMALATKPIAVVQKPKRGGAGKIVVNITATNGQSHSRSARGYPCLTLAWAIYADEYVFSFGEASRPASSTGTTYDPLTSAQPYPLRAVAHINSTKQSNAQLQAQGPGQAIPGEGYEISANYWLRKECLAKWSAEDGTPVTEDPNTHFMTLACGVGGQPLAALLEGAPENYYNRYKTGLIAIRDWYVAEYGAENVEFVVIALDIAHGQETYSELPGGAHNTEALYRTGLQQYRGQMIATIQEVFGNNQLPPATFVGQASGGYVKDGSDLHVGRAQLKLCTDVPGWFWGQPDYPYVNLPSAHPDSNGYRQQGQYRGDAWSQVLLHDRAPKRVYMRAATWDSATNEIVIDMVSTDGPLTTGSPRDGFVPKVMADLGLCVRDSVGLIALENVRFVGAMTIAATPVRTPTEAPMVIAGSKAIANGYVGIRCPATITALENYTLIANAGQHPDANQPDLVDKPYNLDTWCANGAVQAEEI